jgi:hypothetical protein
MSIHDLYAVSTTDLEAANTLLSSALGLDFAGHSSHFFGDYDLAELPDGDGSVRIQPNLNPEFEEGIDSPEEKFMEYHFADHPLLLYVDVEGIAQAEKLRENLLLLSPTIKMLKREQIET